MARSQKNSNSREDDLFSQYQDAYAKNNFPDALTALQEMLKISNIKAFISSLIVDVHMQMGDMNEAYKVAATGIKYPNPPSKLYKQHAEVIFARASTIEDIEELNKALASIDKAIALYNNDSISENIADRFNDAETFKFWFDDRTRTRTDMASLRSDIRSLIYNLKLYNDIQHIESRLSQEKQRTIELMALFTAIIALIFSNVQVLSQKRDIQEIVTANISLVVILSWILYLVGRIGSGERLIPRPSFNSFGNFLGLLIVFLLFIGFIGLMVVDILYIYMWAISIINRVS